MKNIIFKIALLVIAVCQSGYTPITTTYISCKAKPLFFKGTIHQEITEAAGNSLLLSGKITKADLDLIVLGTLSQDNITNYFDEHRRHFDSSFFPEGIDYVNNEWNYIKNTTDRTGALLIFGRILHTIEDFYAHSNWIELNLQQSPIPTWNVSLPMPNGLFSGYWPDANPASSKIPGAPNHDQSNKDEPQSITGKKIVSSGPNKGKTYFQLARETAIRACQEQYQKLTLVLPNLKTFSMSEAIVWNNKKAYFFYNDTYRKYDMTTETTENEYPRLITESWTGLFNNAIDASIMWNNGKAFFFKGNQYIRYDVATDKADAGYPKLVSSAWKGLFPQDINAAVNWGNGKAYFFSGNQYTKYDIATDKAEANYPRPIQGNWKGLTFNKIDAAINWGNGKAYLFSGAQYVRFDIATDKVDAGYPKPIQGNWKGL
jgi:hypothetical protein